MKRDELARQYTAWMQERWNHPCVVIWDAQNESVTTETGAALMQVRGLDLSRRPWDNGWSRVMAGTDVCESHPYHFIKPHMTLSHAVADKTGMPWAYANSNPGNHHAYVINEYGWLWLNRDGTPTTLTKNLYANLAPWSRGELTSGVGGGFTPRGERLQTRLKQECRLEPFGQATVEFEVTWPAASGQYLLEAELRGAEGKPVRSVRELEIIDPRTLGLALRKPATASSSHAKEYLPANAVDGDPATYWSSTFADPAWLAVDLGEIRRISQGRINWQNDSRQNGSWQDAYSKAFVVLVVQVSRDGQNWTDVFTEENGRGGISEIEFAPVEARHVRIFCTRRGTQWGHAIRELQVFE